MVPAGLKYLDFHGNDFTTLDRVVAPGAAALYGLDLSGNRLRLLFQTGRVLNVTAMV